MSLPSTGLWVQERPAYLTRFLVHPNLRLPGRAPAVLTMIHLPSVLPIKNRKFADTSLVLSRTSTLWDLPSLIPQSYNKNTTSDRLWITAWDLSIVSALWTVRCQGTTFGRSWSRRAHSRQSLGFTGPDK